MASVQSPTSQDHKPPSKVSQFAKRPPHTPRGELDEAGVSSAEAASLWAIAIRRNIDLCLEAELPLRPEDLDKFIKEVAAVFIAALQRDSIKQWQYVNEVLKVLQPYVHLLSQNSQLKHYIERTVHHLNKLEDQELADEIFQSINHLSAESLKGAKPTRGDDRNYRTPIPTGNVDKNSNGRANVSFTLPDGSHPYRPPEKFSELTIKPKGISFGDLSDAMPVIIHETVKHDAIWSEGLGLTAAALSTKLPPTKSMVPSEESIIPPRQPDTTWTKDGVDDKTKVNTKPTQDTVSRELKPMTGKEVVERFGKGRHLGKAKFVYLNRSKTRHFRPYDLIEVPQHKANPDEHWIVSCFGIMHKVRGQPSESMALYEWHREAVLWSALMKIPFYKYFLVRKAFHRWRANRKFNDFSNTRQRLESRLLPAVPRFGTSLLQISKLLQELRLLKLLPLEPNHCFTLSEFDFTVLQKYREGKLILGKFFNFCKMILDKTCKDSVDKLKFCESQTKQDKAIFSKESLYVQRQKKEHREKNLAMAQEEASCLGNFVLLVDQILVSHLLALTRINICSFIENSMATGPTSDRDALFAAKLIFTKEHALTLFPDKEKFQANLKQTLDNIPALITEMAKPMEELTTGLIQQPESIESREGYDPGTTPDPSKLSIQLEEPELRENARPRKSRDNLGVATPSYCVPGVSRSDLAIVGERLVGQYNPISHGNLLKRLSEDEKVIASRLTQVSLLDSALADVDAFCEEHSWLKEIHQFVKSWNKDSAKAWRRAQAFSIEAKLAEIRDWTEKVRNVDRMFTTNNALFLVDCESIQTDLVPPLDEAFKDLLNFTASEALRFAGAFTKEIKGVVADMKAKNPDMASFADYAQQYHTYKNKMADLQKEVEYIKSLFEVIRLSYRSLTPEEEENEEQVWQNWEAFLLQLQDAAEFVHVQMPVMTDELDTKFQQQMAEAKKIFHQATSGVYLDPSQNSTKLLSSVLKLFDQFYLAQSEITKCNMYREKMHGKPYDIEELNKMLSLMRVRTELWKYLEASAAAIEDWKLKVFNKFDVQRAIDKITEWQRAAGHLKQYLPQADPVLAFWYKMLADFKQHLPLLLKLSSDALKHRHWRAIFLAIGETYEHNKPYRVMDLLSYDITEKSLPINKICSGAMSEFALEKSLVKLRQVWEEKNFKLAKHLIKGGQPLTSMEQPDVFILICVEELKYILEDSQVSLQNMLVSPHLAGLRPSAELWRSTLSQVDELVELIEECQSKWLYLYKIFSDVEQAVYDADLTVKYDIVNRKFQEIMKAIAADPKVLSILSKRKGQKGWRELQGENLKQILLSMIKVEEGLLKELDHLLTEARMSYPRFSFLNDNDLTDLLAHPSNRQLWIPYIRKLFPGIVGVTLALTSDPFGIHKHLDLQLHADKLEAVSIEGDLKECLTLVNPVTPSPAFASWWKHFENSVKSTVGSMLNTCLESRLREDRLSNPENILEELAALETRAGNSPEERNLQQAVKQSFSHWLLRFPAQCVLVAEGVLWFRQMGKVLASGEKEQLERVKDQLQNRLKQYTSVLRDNVHLYLSSQSRARLHILLSNLIMQTLHYKDIIQGLLKLTDVSDKSFDWKKVLKYSLDMSSILCAKHDEKQEGKTQTITGYVFGPCHVSQLDSSFAYDYEYLGPNLRVVTTPLTDRCHLAMVMAMKQFECGTVVGPTSSGKTESIKDLAEVMGRHLFTVDCTNISSVRMLCHLLSGLVQSGSWGLFENPQRMTEGLLSVFARQLQHVFHAYQFLSNRSFDQNYETRGKSSVETSRRHSVTTLLPTTTEKDENSSQKSRKKIFITSEEADIDDVKNKSRGRRHSIVRGRQVSVTDHYQMSTDPVPLFINRPKSANVQSTPSLQQWRHKPVTLGHLEFDGHLIPASGNFACFITMTTDGIRHPQVPANLKASMRPTSMVIPDILVILETRLICSGFQEHQGLASKLYSLSQILSAQFPENPDCHLDLRVLKSVMDVAALRMYSKRNVYELTGRGSSQNGSTPSVGLPADSTTETDLTDVFEQDELHKEENALVYAIQLHLLPRLKDRHQLHAVKELLRCVFPWGGGGPRPSTGGQEHDPVLLDAIQNQFVADKLQATPQHVNKVIELQETLQHKCGVILVGPAGSGKTVCYHTLARVLNNLHQVPPVEKEEGHKGVPQVPKLKGLSESSPSPSSPSVHRMKFKAEVISRLTLQWLGVATQGKKLPEYPAVDVSVIYPATLSLQEIIGEWSEEGNSWKDGFLTRMIRDASASSSAAKALSQEQVEKAKQKKPFGKGLLSSPSVIEKWMVLDGDVNQTLSDLYHPVVKRGNRQMTLANGEQLSIPSSLSLILETTDLSQASPALVADCAILHFGREVVQWRSLLDSWLGEVKTLWECSNTNFQLLTTLIDEIFPASLDFLSQSGCSFILETDLTPSKESLGPGLREVSTFVKILGALLSVYFKREEVAMDTDPEVKKPMENKLTALLSPSVSSVNSRPASCNPSVLLSSMFVFSYIWGFAGHLHERYWEKFEAFARHILSRSSLDIMIPTEDSLFDYHVDPTQGILVSFSDKSQDRIKTMPSGYTVIPQMERYSHLVDLLLPTSPILLCGAPGVGKSALVQNLVHPKHPYTKLHFSPVFSQTMLEDGLSSKLRPMSVALNPSLASKGVAATGGGRPMFFIDDMNCCSKNPRTGGIPNLELLRQLHSRGGYYNRKSFTFQTLEQFSFLSLCGPPTEAGVGGGEACHSLSPRLTRLLTVFMFNSPDVEFVLAMHGGNLTSWLEEFPAYSLARHQELAKAILSATVALHDTVKRHLTCTPSNPHYIFSHHDIHHVVSGLHLLSARSSRGENRPKHGQRRVGGGGGGGGGSRRQSQAYRGSLQLTTMAPPMMRSVIRLWCHEVTRTYTDRITSVSDMDWFSAMLEDTVEQYFCVAESQNLPPSPSLILEEPSLCSLPYQESLSSEKIEPTEEEDSVPHPINTSLEPQKALTSSSTFISLPAVTTPNSDSLDSEGVQSDFHSRTLSTPGSLDKDQQPLPPIATGKEPAVEDTEDLPLKHEPHPPLVKSSNHGKQITKNRRCSNEDKRSHSPRKGVTFKPGLLSDSGAETLLGGPLITMEQLKSHDEHLTDIAMSKFIATGQKETEKGYMECSSSQLEEGLRKVLGNYNEISATKMTLTLTFFEEALYHMARLTRVLATPGGNALLIGRTHATGRTSLVRLAAFAARCKFYTCHPGHDIEENQAKLRVMMKKASKLAGVYGKPVVMLVKSRLGEPSVQDLCSFLKEGKCPDLYTQDELNHIVSQMLPGAKQARGSRAELALDKYFNRVQTYLHVIISMDCPDGSISMSRRFLQKFPTLMQSVISVDVYQPWSQDAYARVAEHWIQVPTSDPFTGKLIEPSWTSSAKSPGIDVIGKAMAYIHLSSYRALLQYHQLDYKVYSPATFLDFIDLFKNLMWKVVKEEKVNISKYQSALDKINDALGTIQNYESEVASLRPQYQLALEIAQQKQQEVELYQQEFADAKGHCSNDEAEITEMQKPLMEMKKKAQAELDRVNPVYEAALHALRSLDSSALNEIKTFPRPPQPVINVVNALCLLFGEPFGWQSGQALINRDNFFQDLEFYDKANMPDHVFHKLNKLFIQDETFDPDYVAKANQAARSLCMWLHAVYAYASIHRNMRPKISMVEEAEVKLHEAQSHLGQKRVKAQDVQGFLEAKMKEYQECLVHVHNLDRAMKALEDQIAEASHLMMNMDAQHVTWRSALEQSQSNLITSTGDALIAAACATYHGPMEQSMRDKLNADWMQACQTGQFHFEKGIDPVSQAEMIPIRSGFKLEAILSSKEEQQFWEQRALLEDPHATHNALYIRACTIALKRHWPLLLDPNDQALSWIKMLQERGMVSYHEGSDFDREDIRVESVSEREVEEVRETDVKGQEDEEEDIPEDSTDMESSTTTGNGAEYPETPRTLTSVGFGFETSLKTPLLEAVPSGDSETDVFSSSQQTDKISLATVQQDIPKPPLELMVVTSDDPSLPVKLCQAVVMGYTLMVTHIERAPLVDQFREVLGRNVTVGTDGVRKIAIGNNEYAYNPKFKLLLCSSVPLGMQGAGLKPLPVRDTLLINMAVDQKGLQDILMNDVLTAERPEFKNQLRSIREDVRDQRMTIAQAEEEILEKTLQLPHGVLDEESMLDSLIHYQQVVLSTEVTLQESITLQNQLLERRNPFLQVARHGTLLYRTIQKLHRLHPAYYVPQSCFSEWFRDGVRSREKDPTNIAAPRARAVELTNNLTRHVHRWMQQWCFPLHSGLFVFMFATEKMRDGGELTEEEWRMFVGGTEETMEVIEESKPDWLDEKVWSECFSLESIHPAFTGLTKCLLQYSKQWKEYFEHQPVLLAPVPGNILANLSVFQKAILWRIVRPDKVASICHDVTIYQLGSSVSNPGHLSLGSMLPILGPRKPLLCLLPGFSYTEQDHPLSGIEGNFMVNPTEEIEKLSIHSGLEKNFHKVTLGTTEQLKEATRLLKLCQTRGHWLLLENCQAVEKWDEHFMKELKLLLETSNEEDELDGGCPGDSREGRFISRPPIHDNFRLFMVVDADNTNNLPGLILQHSVKRSCSSSDSFKSSLQFYFSLANSRLESEQVRIPATNTKLVHEMTFSLAFFHTILSQRLRYPGLGFKTDYYWDEKDLYSALDYLVTSSSTVPLRDLSSFVEMVGTHIYGGRASNPEDLETIKSLAKSVLIPWRDVQQMPSSMGVGSLLGSLLYSSQSMTRPTTKPANQRAAFQLMFDSMKENVDPLQLGLTKIAPAIIERQQSRFLITSLIHLELEPHLESPREFVSERSKISSMYAKLCEVDDPSDRPDTDNLSHLDSFVNSEIQLLSEKLQSITSDLELLGKALDGQIYLNSNLETVFQAISHDSYPQGWGYPGARDGLRAEQLVEESIQKMELLQSYRKNGKAVVCYEIAAFLRPKRFLKALLMEQARREYMEVQDVTMEIQTMPFQDPPSQPPETGVYVSGFYLHNASWDHHRVTMVPHSRDGAPDAESLRVKLPLMWVKPVHKHFRPMSGTLITSDTTYGCPVYECKELRYKSVEPFMYLSVPCTLQPKIWDQKQVYVTLSET